MKKIIITILLILFPLFLNFKEKEKEIVSIPLKYSRGLYFVTLNLNGKNANFLVDTGAIYSILDINQAKKYKFESKENTLYTFVGLNGTEIVGYNVYHYNLNYNDKNILIRFKGTDMNRLVNSFKTNHTKIVGIIGGNFFRNVDAIIDYKKSELRIIQ